MIIAVVPKPTTVPTPTTIALVKSGQVGRALLENLVEDTFGAKALLEAAKRSSECAPDLGPIAEGAPALKTMKQTFMAEAEKTAVKRAFDPLRLPQAGTTMDRRQVIVISDDLAYTNGKLGNLQLQAGHQNQVSGMVNNVLLPFQYDHNRGTETYFTYDYSSRQFTMLSDGLINFAGELNLMILPVGFERNPQDPAVFENTNPIPYLNPTFLGTRGSNECEYRLSYHHYTAAFTEKGIPDIFHQETLFEGKFTHYDVAKVAEKRHAFNTTIRCKAGDKFHFVLERGRSIANFTGNADVIRTVPYLAKTSVMTNTSHKSTNQIAAIFLAD